MSRAMLARKAEAAPAAPTKTVAKNSCPSLRIGEPDDAFEREADRVANAVMAGGDKLPLQWSLSRMSIDAPLQRQCSCGGAADARGECEACKQKKTLQREATGAAQTNQAPPIVHEALGTPGRPLDRATRDFFEPRFGHDFSRVRVHADANAAQSARAVNALAYTVGADVVLDPARVRPDSTEGQQLLAHELAHVVQQCGHEATSVTSGNLALMRLTPEQFRTQLGATPDEKTAIDALFANPQFKGLCDYLLACRAGPQQDLGPLALKVTPGLKIGGVERFGGYSPMTRTLEINPTKPEHTANPQELVDTIVHELIHAVDHLDDSCVRAGSPPSPLAATGAGTVNSPPTLASVKGTPDEDKLLKELGPGASNPCEEFIDINKQAQQIIVGIIQSDIQTTRIGRPTLTFVNDTLRKNPAALAEYKACRDVACAKPNPDARKAAIGQCSQAIITKYVLAPAAPAASTPAPVPAPPSTPPPRQSP
jgi:Domain of unknown function (DUF4157)